MEIELSVKKKFPIKSIAVSAQVRYWEDGEIDGIADEDGHMPLRRGDCWEPTIDLRTGAVRDWPQGITADVHYKVCDAGQYWLLDSDGQRVAKWAGDYVPDDILCVGSRGYGDYIIFKIGADGLIEGWKPAFLDPDQWEPV